MCYNIHVIYFFKKGERMKIIALQGKGETGKTTTLKLLINKTFENFEYQTVCSSRVYKDIKKEIELERINRSRNIKYSIDDITIVLKINEKIIGICTQGDTDELLKDAFKIFDINKCQLCFCACRTRGNTVDFLNFRKKEALTIIKKNIIRKINMNFDDKINDVNSQQAQELLSFITDYVTNDS